MVLAPEIELWAGGGGVQRLAPIEGVLLLTSFESAVSALTDWRLAQVPA